ncbi:uncharacterized protein ELE39_000984 [Cryptosporidium sp. chipmunk genotype I]|uniref:uncharacterized protein n=1 Tax=Cryptosporidium sp. chipmunk genotype I TaxID=1280935 RepID=UPI00351A505E|nr:hypothetical protein ELE39_000984 [Cryptosporidium sp. chipmunk genotype I]
MFICEVSEKILEDGDCCWIHGFVVDIEIDQDGELDMITLDDGTSSVRISIKNKLNDVSSGNFHEDTIKIYRQLIEELVQKGRFISVVCQLNKGILKVLHISDSINGSRDSENEWINSTIRSRSLREDRS